MPTPSCRPRAVKCPLSPDDLERLAVAAYLAGRDADSEEAWTGAHHHLLAVAGLAPGCTVRSGWASR